jgi:hypothetical protein
VTFFTPPWVNFHLSATIRRANVQAAENGWVVPSQDLLSAKFSVPLVRAERVHRPRLVERLNEALGRDLLLVSAPAGFGKTTLISGWVSNLRSNGRVRRSTTGSAGSRRMKATRCRVVIGIPCGRSSAVGWSEWCRSGSHSTSFARSSRAAEQAGKSPLYKAIACSFRKIHPYLLAHVKAPGTAFWIR